MGSPSIGPDPGDAEVAADAFDAMPVLMVATEGPDHRLVAANQLYRSFVDRPDLLGLPARQAFPDITGQRLFELLDRVFTSGEPVTAREWRLEMTGSSGLAFPFFSDLTAAPWRRADGSIRGVLISQADVTERVRHRQAAEQSQRRYEVARDLIVRLQAALLPAGVPVLPGLDIAAGYLVAEQEQSAGGDWFDVIVLPDGAVALVLGDVVGHGVTASTAMGRARAVLAEMLAETGDVVRAVRRLEALAERWPELRGTSLCVAVLDQVGGGLRYLTCGHPPPLIVDASGGSRFLVAGAAGLLGSGSSARLAADRLDPGDMVVLYSDGLIEQPGRPLDAGLTALADVARTVAAGTVFTADGAVTAAERVCRETVELLTRGGYHDDVTVIAGRRRRHPVAPVETELPATVEAVAAVRAVVRRWLRDVRAPGGDDGAVELAVTELVANAVEHAYPPGEPGRVRLHLELRSDGVVEVMVADDGRWQEPGPIPPATSGRGLWMVGETTDELVVEHPDPPRATGRSAGGGTTATARRRLRRPAQMASGPPEPVAAPVADIALVLDDGPPRTLRVSGAIDVVTAVDFADRLAVTSRGGVNPVVVDLSDVHVLASAGLQVLLAAQRRFRVHGHRLVVRARPGSVPARVLELAQFPYEAWTAETPAT